jgi:hypothetical protein
MLQEKIETERLNLGFLYLFIPFIHVLQSFRGAEETDGLAKGSPDELTALLAVIIYEYCVVSRLTQ